MMKNTFYFTLKAFFVPNIIKFLSWHFGHVKKQGGYDVTICLKNNYNTHIAQYLTKWK